MSVPLTPLGAVRRRLGALPPHAAPYPDWLVRAARERDLGEEVVYLAWELSQAASDLDAAEREALASLAVVSMEAVRLGNTYVSVGDIPDRLKVFGASDGLVDIAERLLEREGDVVGRPGDYKPLIVDDGRLYHQRVHRQEESVTRELEGRLGAKTKRTQYAKILDALDRILAHPAVVNGRAVLLTIEQQQAIRTALSRPLTVVSGGPGSGKTSIVVSILRVLARLDVAMRNIVLAAPTGRAARRMAESIELGLDAVPEPKILDAGILDALPQPRTLHRLLGYSPTRRRFHHDASNPLPYQLVIVDEASMIDLELMDRLLLAVRPQAHLVLLGDADQLPSVGAGAVFANIVLAGRDRGTVELRESHRVDRTEAGGRTLDAAFRAVQSGDAAGPDGLMRSVVSRERAHDVSFQGVELLEGDHERFVDRWMDERILTARYFEAVEGEPFDADAVFSHLRTHGMLAVTRYDVERLNRACRRRHPSREGEPVIVLANDYERGRFNGERGVVVGGDVVFETGITDVLTQEISAAYAITVHKSQGAEYDHVALWLPRADHPLLTRELLYTAMTRARKSVTLLGSREAVAAGCSRVLERVTGILSRLA